MMMTVIATSIFQKKNWERQLKNLGLTFHKIKRDYCLREENILCCVAEDIFERSHNIARRIDRPISVIWTNFELCTPYKSEGFPRPNDKLFYGCSFENIFKGSEILSEIGQPLIVVHISSRKAFIYFDQCMFELHSRIHI
jgi:hypothetical protein